MDHGHGARMGIRRGAEAAAADEPAAKGLH